MKISKVALTAMIAGACLGGQAFGQANRNAPRYYPASYYSYSDAVEAPPAPEAPAEDDVPAAPAPIASSAAYCDSTLSCDSYADLCNGKSSCGSFARSSCFGGIGDIKEGLISTIADCRDLDDPWKLFPCGIHGWDVGGWTTVGYHSHSNPNSFNTYDGNVQLSQQWLYAEKVADGSHGIGFGGRIDYVYGTDAPDTQTFGTPTRWDDSWDNGSHYGHALPQLYFEVAAGDLSVKLGKFYTIIGNEVVQSTGNFFYSRQFAFYNAEPFTHTGGLASYKVDDRTDVFGGYVLGWDSGFDDNGDAFLSGFRHQLSDDLSFVYTNAMGRFGDRLPSNERGWIHSAILTANLTERLSYIQQVDAMFTRDSADAAHRNTFANIHYLIYQHTERVSFGQRFEWFNFSGQGFGGVDNSDLYNYTLGMNYRHSANLLFRPEVRTVWDKTNYGFNENGKASQTSVGGDIIFTF